jgi:predicted metalloendopeptidase
VASYYITQQDTEVVLPTTASNPIDLGLEDENDGAGGAGPGGIDPATTTGGEPEEPECRPGYSLDELPNSTVTPECEIEYVYPEAADDRIMSDLHQPCEQFMLHSCGAWFEEAVPGEGRAFQELVDKTDELTTEIIDVEAQRNWDRGALNLFFHGCVESYTFGDTKGHTIQIDHIARIGALTTWEGMLDEMAGLQKLGYVTPMIMRVELNPTDTNESLLYLEQSGLFGIGADDVLSRAVHGVSAELQSHYELVHYLFSKIDADSAVAKTRIIEDMELELATGFQMSFSEDLLQYVSTGELNSDLFSLASLEHIMTNVDMARFFTQMHSPEFAAAVASRRIWLFKSDFFAHLNQMMGGGAGSQWDLDSWKVYLELSVLYGTFWTLPQEYSEVHLRSDLDPTPEPEAAETPTKGASSADQHEPRPVSTADTRTRDQRRRRDQGRAGNIGIGGDRLLPWRRSQIHSLTQWQADNWRHRLVLLHDRLPSDITRSHYANLCRDVTAVFVPEMVDRWFVETRLPDQERERLLNVTIGIIKAYERRIERVAWMTPTHKQLSIDKLEGIIPRIAVPTEWPPKLPVDEMGESYFENVRTIQSFHNCAELSRLIGGETRDGAFLFPSTTVNAYYHPLENTITVLAGILQPPFYWSRYDDVSVYAGIGMIIGHEIGHAFDLSGRQFGPTGNVEDWWEQSVRDAYDQEAECLVGYYSTRTLYGNNHNGWRTQNENIADQLGLQVAFDAAFHGKTPTIDEKKAFFEAYSQAWCAKMSRATELSMISQDVHSTVEFRINKVLYNFQEFLDTYSCNRAPTCPLW